MSAMKSGSCLWATCACLLTLAYLAPALSAQSEWYLERGTERRTARAEDDLPEAVFILASLLRDGDVPGFYDGQFAALRGHIDDLVRIAHDEALHHTLRVMAVMALQEASDGEPLAAALGPLLIDPEVEHQVDRMRAEREYHLIPLELVDEADIRLEFAVELSRYARFALAKDGQPEAILARIRVLEQFVSLNRDKILDRSISAFERFDVYFGRSLWFDIGYHYQQFDDYASARRWFEALSAHLDPSEARMAHYNLACIASLEGEHEEALVQLRLAVSGGFLDIDWMEEDGDLAGLRELPEYQALRSELLGTALPPAEGDAP